MKKRRNHLFGWVLAALVAMGMLSACGFGPEAKDPLSGFPGANEQKQKDAELAKAANSEQAPEGTIAHGEGMTRPVYVQGPPMSLPPRAIENHRTGTFIARCTITELGNVEDCKILQGIPDATQHILQIILAQKYTPVIYKDKPQRVRYTFKIAFK